jgi:hypothetical protein
MTNRILMVRRERSEPRTTRGDPNSSTLGMHFTYRRNSPTSSTCVEKANWSTGVTRSSR